jgi:hypothetical protein
MIEHVFDEPRMGCMLERTRKRLSKKARRGCRGFPVATVAFYGPDDTRATKLTVGIVPAENAEVTDLRRWFAEAIDIRNDTHAAEEVLAFIEAAGARSVVMTDRIIGCPHEEGIDYEGPTCPHFLGRTRPLDREACALIRPRPPLGLGERRQAPDQPLPSRQYHAG